MWWPRRATRRLYTSVQENCRIEALEAAGHVLTAPSSSPASSLYPLLYSTALCLYIRLLALILLPHSYNANARSSVNEPDCSHCSQSYRARRLFFCLLLFSFFGSPSDYPYIPWQIARKLTENVHCGKRSWSLHVHTHSNVCSFEIQYAGPFVIELLRGVHTWGARNIQPQTETVSWGGRRAKCRPSLLAKPETLCETGDAQREREAVCTNVYASLPSWSNRHFAWLCASPS